MTTSQASNYSLTPGSSGAPGTDTYNYDQFSRVSADAQTGAGGNNSTDSYNNNEMATSSGLVIHNCSYTYQSDGSDSGKLQSIGLGLICGYDAAGNRTCQGTASPSSSSTTDTYTWDAENRLSQWADTSANSTVFTYDGNGLLQKSYHSYKAGSCLVIPGGDHSSTRGAIAPDLTTCTEESHLTWTTALGTPTLAVDHYYRTGYDEGYTDFIMGPLGLPLEQVDSGTSPPLQSAAQIR